jgi:hypothetical protein
MVSDENLRFEVLTAVNIHTIVFPVPALYKPFDG